MKQKSENKLDFLNFMIAMVAFLQLQPYFLWENKLPRFFYGIIFFFIGYILIITKITKITPKNLTLVGCMAAITIYMNYGGFKMILVNLILAIPIYLYALLSTEDKKKVYFYFSYIFAIALLPSIIIYLLSLFNLNLSWEYLEPLNPLKTEAGIYYKKYFGAVTLVNPHSLASGKLYRLCGMFDEPGVIGTVSALILIGSGYNIKKNLKNTTIFIGGILSFSLFFYIITLLYYTIGWILEKKGKNAILGIVILIIITIFSTGIVKNEFVNRTIVSRMTIQDGKLQGNNRTTEYFEQRFNEFLNSGIGNVLFGMGPGASSEDKLIESSASWKKMVYNNGFVGLSVLILFLIINLFMINKSKGGILLLLVMIACIYQRPGIFDLPNIVVYLGGLIVQSNDNIDSEVQSVGNG